MNQINKRAEPCPVCGCDFYFDTTTMLYVHSGGYPCVLREVSISRGNTELDQWNQFCKRVAFCERIATGERAES